MDFLKTYEFTHGLPSLNSIAFSDNTSCYKYKDHQIASPITLHLIPSGHSSMMITSQSHQTIYKLYHMGRNVLLNYDEYKSRLDEGVNTKYYKIDDVESFIHTTKYLGMNVYNSSFDFYALITSMISDDSFRAAVITDQLLINLLYELIPDLAIYLESVHTVFSSNSESITRYLSRFSLNSDAIVYIF